MLRGILHDLKLGIVFVILTIVLFLVIALLTIGPVIATITETDMAPGPIHSRSEHMLTDEARYKWETMFVTQANSTQVAALNLRLSGLYGSLKIQSQEPVIIDTQSDRYKVSDIFLQEPPLPSIGQYDLKNSEIFIDHK